MALREVKQVARGRNSRIAKQPAFLIDPGIMKKATVCLTLAAVAVATSLSSCKRTRSAFSGGKEGSYVEEQETLPPTTDSAEWLKRFGPEKSLHHAFSELPPQAEWPPVLQRLRQPGDELRTIKERLFGEVLAEDDAAAARTIRDLLLKKKKQMTGYNRENALKYLHSFSTDPAGTLKWVESSLPKADPESAYSSGNHNDEISKLLAETRVNEAIAALRVRIDAASDASDKPRELDRLVVVARLMDRHPLYEDTVAEMKALALRTAPGDVYGTYHLSVLLDELARLKDWTALREIGIRFRQGHAAAEFHPICLTATYQLEGPAAFLAELRHSPEWNVVDSNAYVEVLMGNLFQESFRIGDMVVRSLLAAGEKENARMTLEYLLALDMGNDTWYRLALEHFPEQAAAMFEAVQVRNRYQERPLIWLAEIALGKKDLATAQELIDRAIALDPSDGEQGKLTRMQAYDVLSRILREKGDAEKAALFSDVMKAIRQGEEADDYLYAGLTQEAIRRYQEALGHFKDAYCLQSRLAKPLLEAGKDEEAMKHFEKAFELMPVSFGPVESHCFGCEKIFEDDRVKEIAVKTFNRIIAATPENPRTFYLLGLVLEEMDQPVEAAAAMKKALVLDPKYYNCAVRLEQLLARNPETVKEARVVLRQVVGMAPHEDVQRIYQSRTDLNQTWLDAQTPPPSPPKLAPLPLPFKAGKPAESSSYYFNEDKLKSLDGWTTQELLEENDFLDWLDSF